MDMGNTVVRFVAEDTLVGLAASEGLFVLEVAVERDMVAEVVGAFGAFESLQVWDIVLSVWLWKSRRFLGFG